MVMPGELGLMLEQVVHLALVDRVLDGDRRERVAAVLLDLRGDVGERDLEDPREAAQLLVGAVLRKVGGPDLHGRRVRVLDEDAAVAVLDRAARRVQAKQAELVVLRGDEELVPGEHLQRPQADEEDGEHDEREEAEDPDPEDELRRQPVRRVDARIARQEAARAKRGRAASQRTRPPGGVTAPRTGA